MKTSAVVCVSLLTACLTLSRGNVPKSGFVPDSRTAIKIAEAVLVPVYGEGQIADEQPFKASLEGDVWTVSGTLNCKDENGKIVSNQRCKGGVAVVKLSKIDGRIISMIHYK
jgi:hypothetical protein